MYFFIIFIVGSFLWIIYHTLFLCISWSCKTFLTHLSELNILCHNYHTHSQLFLWADHHTFKHAWESITCDPPNLTLRFWFGLGQCNHNRWRDAVIQRLLPGQPMLCRTSAGVWSQATAGVLPAFPHTRGRQQRSAPGEVTRAAVPAATCAVAMTFPWITGWSRGHRCMGGWASRKTGLYFVSAGHHECLQILISWGIDVDQDIPHLGTPLYVACMSQQFHCIRKLLYAGNDL